MKFYKDKRFYYWNKIEGNKLNAIHLDGCVSGCIRFLKSGELCNNKNAAYVQGISGYKSFYLDGKHYGDENDFTKQSWRKFFKLQAFL